MAKTVIITQDFQLQGRVYKRGQQLAGCDNPALISLAEHGELAKFAGSKSASKSKGGKE
jgi:hypothetical protein